MRGKDDAFHVVGYRVGITPAYAGKRKHRNQRNDRRRDHPRVCGEKTLYRRATAQMLGSPPRMRGKAHIPAGNRASMGITPAYAGKSESTGLQFRQA